MLIINNVNDKAKVADLAKIAKRDGIINEFYFVSENGENAMAALGRGGVQRESFVDSPLHSRKIKALLHGKKMKKSYDGYISSIPAITAIFLCDTDYLLYFDEDASLCDAESREWIKQAIGIMERNEKYVVANPIWNGNIEEVESESIGSIESFYVSQGFSNQCFLINVERVKTWFDFNEKVPYSLKKQYPYYAGNCFERRFATFMVHHNLYRLTAKEANYFHEDFTPEGMKKWKRN